MNDFILEWLADSFGNPCEYEFGGESAVDVIDVDGQFCNENCGIPTKDCWRRYFEVIMEKSFKK